ncbi:MBL fold metallo-hydrolase [Labrys monachus]|uniref:Ribonuclease BN (tRNA processing enzyme) n=1 Tax=Labrys monachus TaxID=217067 RepID=A0ABU0FIB7_9HYPH|nr:MBL fold metallo-hydrolase [Labrys monachus]MDQ0394325.1 ribonuclease BN (tRNA processing enzyme) [Labrys monachus]
MRVTVIGCGDAFGSGGRYNTATLVEARNAANGARGAEGRDGPVCLLDCGATTMTAINAMGVDPDRIDLIVLTHLHGDHFGGIPFLLLDAQWVRRRTRPLRIIGPPGTVDRLHVMIEALFAGSSLDTPWSFPWSAEDMTPGTQQTAAGFTIITAEVSHPSGSPATAVRLEAAGKAFVHSGDTEWTEALPAIAAGADLLFLECFAVEATPPHLDYARLLANREAFDAERVVLTHMGPSMLDYRGNVDRDLFELAEDGLVFDL